MVTIALAGSYAAWVASCRARPAPLPMPDASPLGSVAFFLAYLVVYLTRVLVDGRSQPRRPPLGDPVTTRNGDLMGLVGASCEQ